jgi:hypothetical protein
MLVYEDDLRFANVTFDNGSTMIKRYKKRTGLQCGEKILLGIRTREQLDEYFKALQFSFVREE